MSYVSCVRTFIAEKALFTNRSNLPFCSRVILSKTAFMSSSFVWSHFTGIQRPPRASTWFQKVVQQIKYYMKVIIMLVTLWYQQKK